MNRISDVLTIAMHCYCVNRWTRMAGIVEGGHVTHTVMQLHMHLTLLTLTLMEQACHVA